MILGNQVVGCHWLCTPKCRWNFGEIESTSHCQGYSQSYVVDYFKTVAPAAKFNTVRELIASAAKCSWDILQFDVKNTFLHGGQKEDVHMEPPPGYQLVDKPNVVCKLKKSLYGLNRSSWAWWWCMLCVRQVNLIPVGGSAKCSM